MNLLFFLSPCVQSLLQKSGLEKADSGLEWKTKAAALEICLKSMTLPPHQKGLSQNERCSKALCWITKRSNQFLRVGIVPPVLRKPFSHPLCAAGSTRRFEPTLTPFPPLIHPPVFNRTNSALDATNVASSERTKPV